MSFSRDKNFDLKKTSYIVLLRKGMFKYMYVLYLEYTILNCHMSSKCLWCVYSVCGVCIMFVGVYSVCGVCVMFVMCV